MPVSQVKCVIQSPWIKNTWVVLRARHTFKIVVWAKQSLHIGPHMIGQWGLFQSLPVTPWLHKRYPHLAHSPSPVIHESADNLFFGREDFSVQQVHMHMPYGWMCYGMVWDSIACV